MAGGHCRVGHGFYVRTAFGLLVGDGRRARGSRDRYLALAKAGDVGPQPVHGLGAGQAGQIDRTNAHARQNAVVIGVGKTVDGGARQQSNCGGSHHECDHETGESATP